MPDVKTEDNTFTVITILAMHFGSFGSEQTSGVRRNATIAGKSDSRMESLCALMC